MGGSRATKQKQQGSWSLTFSAPQDAQPGLMTSKLFDAIHAERVTVKQATMKHLPVWKCTPVARGQQYILGNLGDI